MNPILQAADIAWCHGEAMAALLAARNEEGPAQQAAEEEGYDRELCSYARTHIGCSVLTQRSTPEEISNLPADGEVRKRLASRIPAPDMIISAYPFCSTGQQWDDMIYRTFGKRVPIFNISMPWIWGNKPSAKYMSGPGVPRVGRLHGEAAARVRGFHRGGHRQAVRSRPPPRGDDVHQEGRRAAPRGDAPLQDQAVAGELLRVDQQHRSGELPPGRPAHRRLLCQEEGGDPGAGRQRHRRGSRGAVSPLLGRHHELEQDRLARRQVRQLRRLRGCPVGTPTSGSGTSRR